RREPGGTQAVVLRLADSLRQRGHCVTEAWSEPGPRASEHEWIRPLEAGTTKSNLPALGSALRGGISLLQLAAGLAKRRPQIVNIHFLRGQTIYFLLLRKILGYKVVLSIHGSDLLRPPESIR